MLQSQIILTCALKKFVSFIALQIGTVAIRFRLAGDGRRRRRKRRLAYVPGRRRASRQGVLEAAVAAQVDYVPVGTRTRMTRFLMVAVGRLTGVRGVQFLVRLGHLRGRRRRFGAVRVVANRRRPRPVRGAVGIDVAEPVLQRRTRRFFRLVAEEFLLFRYLDVVAGLVYVDDARLVLVNTVDGTLGPVNEVKIEMNYFLHFMKKHCKNQYYHIKHLRFYSLFIYTFFSMTNGSRDGKNL